MSKRTIPMVQNDTGPSLELEIQNDDKSVRDLTGHTVKFIIKKGGTVTNDGHTACTITDAAAGLATYDFQAGDIATPGSYLCDVEVTDASGKKQTEYKHTELLVRAEAG